MYLAGTRGRGNAVRFVAHEVAEAVITDATHYSKRRRARSRMTEKHLMAARGAWVQ